MLAPNCNCRWAGIRSSIDFAPCGPTPARPDSAGWAARRRRRACEYDGGVHRASRAARSRSTPELGQAIRLESVQNATDQANTVAKFITFERPVISMTS
jgi:hypothetical protein